MSTTTSSVAALAGSAATCPRSATARSGGDRASALVHAPVRRARVSRGQQPAADGSALRAANRRRHGVAARATVCASATAVAEVPAAPKPIYRKDYTPTPYTIETVHLR